MCHERWALHVLDKKLIRKWDSERELFMTGLKTTYSVHLGLIRKRVMDFILVLIKFSSLCVTVEALRAKIDRKSAISLQRGHFDPKFQLDGVIIFARIVRSMNALQLCRWQFSHRCYGWGATNENTSKIGDFAPTRSLWSKISGTRGCPHLSFLHG